MRNAVQPMMDWLEIYKFIQMPWTGQPLKLLTVCRSVQVSEQRGSGRQKHRE